MELTKQLYSTSDVCEITGLTQVGVRWHIYNNNLKASKVSKGRDWIIRKRDLIKFLNTVKRRNLNNEKE